MHPVCSLDKQGMVNLVVATSIGNDDKQAGRKDGQVDKLFEFYKIRVLLALVDMSDMRSLNLHS